MDISSYDTTILENKIRFKYQLQVMVVDYCIKCKVD